jgi:hypothetical protein
MEAIFSDGLSKFLFVWGVELAISDKEIILNSSLDGREME